MRPALVRLHRYAGLALAAYLVIAGLTGSLIAFREEVDRWLNPDLLAASGQADARPLAELLSAVEAFDPRAWPIMIVLPKTPHESAAFHMQPHVDPTTGARHLLGYASLHVDPATARILGTRDADGPCCDRRTFVRFLYVLHYSLHGGPLLRIALGVVALIWLIDCFVGFVLTLPQGRPFWRKWRTSWAVKRPAAFPRRNLDLHRAGGLWLWAVLLILAFTGAFLNLRTQVFLPALKSVSSVTPSVFEARPAWAERGPPRLSFAEAQAAAVAEAARLGWRRDLRFLWYGSQHRIYHIGFDAPDDLGVTSEIFVDGMSGAILQRRALETGTVGDAFLALQLPLHSGHVLGLPGRILISLSGLATAILSVTGVIVWLRKRRARRLSPSSVNLSGAASPPIAPRSVPRDGRTSTHPEASGRHRS